MGSSVTDELQKAVGRKILAFAEESADFYYVMLQLNQGKTLVLWSETPIRAEVEQEQ